MYIKYRVAYTPLFVSHMKSIVISRDIHNSTVARIFTIKKTNTAYKSASSVHFRERHWTRTRLYLISVGGDIDTLD